MNKKSIPTIILLLILLLIILMAGCINNGTIPHVKRWGIYSLDVSTNKIGLIYSNENEISTLRLNNNGDTFVFSLMVNGSDYNHSEICLINQDGTQFQQLTDNNYWDLYPTWSPDGTKIAFLSFREENLDIYIMNKNGSNQQKFYDSGDHDADIHWIHDTIVFTSGSKIWKINEDGTNPTTMTFPPKAGEWGNANLPFGDYDPNIHPDGTKIAFERLENDTSIHGNYNIFTISTTGDNETRLTDNYYTQGFPTWSHTGDTILLMVSAIHDEGIYDLYLMNADGSDYRSITPTYVPNNFLCHQGIFSTDDSIIYFIGEWWE